MVVWKTVPGKYKTAVDQFLKAAVQSQPARRPRALAHAGLNSRRHLIEASDLATREHVALSGLMFSRFDIYPVMEDAEAGAAGRRYSDRSALFRRANRETGGR